MFSSIFNARFLLFFVLSLHFNVDLESLQNRYYSQRHIRFKLSFGGYCKLNMCASDSSVSLFQYDPKKIRNFSIIAHIGKFLWHRIFISVFYLSLFVLSSRSWKEYSSRSVIGGNKDSAGERYARTVTR